MVYGIWYMVYSIWCMTRKVPTYSLYMIPRAILDIWLKASFKYYFVVSPTRA